MNIQNILLPTIILLFLDSIFLFFSKKMFDEQIASVQRVSIQINYVGVILSYLFIILGLYFLIIKPKRSVYEAFILGVVIYGVYETTNYATLKRWNPKIVIMDTLWGGILLSTTTYLSYKFM